MKRKVIYLYKETHLPDKGWLQGCFICNSITSNTEDFNPLTEEGNTRYIVHICPPCLKKKNSSVELKELYLYQLNDYLLQMR